MGGGGKRGSEGRRGMGGKGWSEGGKIFIPEMTFLSVGQGSYSSSLQLVEMELYHQTTHQFS